MYDEIRNYITVKKFHEVAPTKFFNISNVPPTGLYYELIKFSLQYKGHGSSNEMLVFCIKKTTFKTNKYSCLTLNRKVS